MKLAALSFEGWDAEANMPTNPFELPKEVGTARPESDGNPLKKTLLAIGCLGAALLLAILLVVTVIVFAVTQYK
jgi:hypothetical protein